MRALKDKVPSAAQAKLLARMWGEGRRVHVMTAPREGGTLYIEPTERALIREGWIGPTGATGKFPSGALHAEHAITDAGIDALERFLMAQRLKRK